MVLKHDSNLHLHNAAVELLDILHSNPLITQTGEEIDVSLMSAHRVVSQRLCSQRLRRPPPARLEARMDSLKRPRLS